MRGINPNRSQSGAAHRPDVLGEHLAADVQDLLIAGSRKVAGHYKRLISNTDKEREGQLFIDRVGREGRVIQFQNENGRYA